MSISKTSLPASWPADLNTLPKRWGAALANNLPGAEHDVKFLVGQDRKPISCHKLVLAVSSPVFRAMFSCSFKTENEIDIPDVGFIEMTNVIKYFYSGTMDVEVKDALPTMYAAHKYDIPELAAHCSNLLNSNLSVENAVTIYQSAVILQDMNLIKKAEKFIVANFPKVMTTGEFLEFSDLNLINFIQMDGLDITPEVELFNAVIKWAQHQCVKSGKCLDPNNLKEFLEGVIIHIRFPIMTAMEFTKHVEPLGIFNIEERYNLFKYFSLSETERLSVDHPMRYNTNPRKPAFKIKFWDANKKMFFCKTSRTHRSSVGKMGNRPTVDTAVQIFRIYQNYVGAPTSLLLRRVSLISPAMLQSGVRESLHLDVKITISKETSYNQKTEIAQATFSKPDAKPEELYEITLNQPVKLEFEQEYWFEVEYIKGQHFDVPYSTTTWTAAIVSDGSKFIEIEHTDGSYVLAAMEFMV